MEMAKAKAAPVEMMKVRCMRDVYWGPDKDTHQLYPKGSELVIPRSRFTDWHKPETITGPTGKSITVRGSFEDCALYAAPVEDAMVEQNTKMQSMYNENEQLRERLAQLEAEKADAAKAAVNQVNRTPGKMSGKKDEI